MKDHPPAPFGPDGWHLESPIPNPDGTHLESPIPTRMAQTLKVQSPTRVDGIEDQSNNTDNTQRAKSDGAREMGARALS